MQTNKLHSVAESFRLSEASGLKGDHLIALMNALCRLNYFEPKRVQGGVLLIQSLDLTELEDLHEALTGQPLQLLNKDALDNLVKENPTMVTVVTKVVLLKPGEEPNEEEQKCLEDFVKKQSDRLLTLITKLKDNLAVIGM